MLEFKKLKIKTPNKIPKPSFVLLSNENAIPKGVICVHVIPRDDI